MKEIIKNNKLILFIGLFTMVFSCSEKPLGIYIDINKQAIVSCDGFGLKEIEIQSDSSDLTLEGTASNIYFNRKNAVSRTSIYNRIVEDYVLKLKPNCNYLVTKYNEHDRGPIKLTFQTDSLGKVIKASNENCN